jgi:sugar phosphate isomerase/epimerase
LIPGHGAIDLETTLAAIQRTGYNGWVTIELYPYIDQPDDAAREARRYLLGLMAKLGIDVEGRLANRESRPTEGTTEH